MAVMLIGGTSIQTHVDDDELDRIAADCTVRRTGCNGPAASYRCTPAEGDHFTIVVGCPSDGEVSMERARRRGRARRA